MNARKIAQDMLNAYFGGKNEIDLNLSNAEIRRINKRLRRITNGLVRICHSNRIWYLQESI